MPPMEPLLSATILLVRDGARGLEVFMVQRHHRIDFATGAMVFPGGKLEPGDHAPALRGLLEGAIEGRLLAAPLAPLALKTVHDGARELAALYADLAEARRAR